MRKLLPVGSVIVPLVITAIAFKWFAPDQLVGPVVGISLLLGWIGLGLSSFRKRWVKVLLVVAYPFVMLLAVSAVIVVVYGIPGLD